MPKKLDEKYLEKLKNKIGIDRIVLCVEACEGITDEFLKGGFVEFALTNPHFFIEKYNTSSMTYDKMEIWEP